MLMPSLLLPHPYYAERSRLLAVEDQIRSREER